MTHHRNPAPADPPAPRLSEHSHAAAVLDTILLIAAMVVVVAVVVVASTSIPGLEPGTLPSPTPVGY